MQFFPDAFQLRTHRRSRRSSLATISLQLISPASTSTTSLDGRPSAMLGLAAGKSAPRLRVPSIPSPESWNYLFNPLHPRARSIKVAWARHITRRQAPLPSLLVCLSFRGRDHRQRRRRARARSAQHPGLGPAASRRPSSPQSPRSPPPSPAQRFKASGRSVGDDHRDDCRARCIVPAEFLIHLGADRPSCSSARRRCLWPRTPTPTARSTTRARSASSIQKTPLSGQPRRFITPRTPAMDHRLARRVQFGRNGQREQRATRN